LQSQGGGGQGRPAGVVRRVDGRAQLEQQAHDVGPVHRRRVVQGCAPVLVAAHPCRQQCRITLDEAPDLVGAVERDGGPEGQPRAFAEQIVGYVLAHAAEARRPADHGELMVVAVPDHAPASTSIWTRGRSAVAAAKCSG
jgi:hypothetical protein